MGIKGFKGFNKNMKCRDKQYEIGKTFEEDVTPEICSKGLHFCEYPLDVFYYYPPCDSRYAEVEAVGVIDDKASDDSKMSTNRLKISAEIGIPGLVKAAVEYIKENVNKEYTKQSTGNGSAATNTGNRSVAASIGNRSAATNTGDQSAATNIGNQSAATNTGDWSVATVEGTESVAISLGIEGRAKGSLGCWIVLAEWGWDRNKGRYRKDVKCFLVDGEKIKADAFYVLKEGEAVEWIGDDEEEE